jgi:sulfopropanediol 3-dehydrogenase
VATFLKEPPHQSGEDDIAVGDTVKQILSDVRHEGLAAVRRYSERFDKWSPSSFRVSKAEIDEATRSLDRTLRRHIDFAADQIRNFALAQRSTMTDIEVETMPGVVLGHRNIPVASVGSYSPGGLYPLIASSLMTVITPKAAGVGRGVAAARGPRHPSTADLRDGQRRRRRDLVLRRGSCPGRDGLRNRRLGARGHDRRGRQRLRR